MVKEYSLYHPAVNEGNRHGSYSSVESAREAIRACRWRTWGKIVPDHDIWKTPDERIVEVWRLNKSGTETATIVRVREMRYEIRSIAEQQRIDRSCSLVLAKAFVRQLYVEKRKNPALADIEYEIVDLVTSQVHKWKNGHWIIDSP